MTYMRIYWKKKPDVLKALIKKYAGNKDVKQIGYIGWEILINSEEITREIKKYCQYRNKNITIDEIYETNEVDETDDIDELEEEMYETLIDNKIEEEIYETDEADALEYGIGLDYMEISTIISQWQDFYSELPSEETLMDLYQKPEFRCSCNPADGCGCEENYIRQKMIEELILQGTYRNICYSRKRLEMQKMMGKYY